MFFEVEHDRIREKNKKQTNIFLVNLIIGIFNYIVLRYVIIVNTFYNGGRAVACHSFFLTIFGKLW